MTSSKHFKFVVQNVAYIVLAKLCKDVCFIPITCVYPTLSNALYVSTDDAASLFQLQDLMVEIKRQVAEAVVTWGGR